MVQPNPESVGTFRGREGAAAASLEEVLEKAFRELWDLYGLGGETCMESTHDLSLEMVELFLSRPPFMEAPLSLLSFNLFFSAAFPAWLDVCLFVCLRILVKFLFQAVCL